VRECESTSETVCSKHNTNLCYSGRAQVLKLKAVDVEGGLRENGCISELSPRFICFKIIHNSRAFCHFQVSTV
jgi:hypothetical protein